LAIHLSSLGLEKGDRVVVFMKNGLLYPAALLGAFRGGFVAVPINAELHPREVAFIVEKADAKAVVVDNDLVDEFAAAGGSAEGDHRRGRPQQLSGKNDRMGLGRT
jgi:long-chain acyl-CoA synthetase